MQINPRLFEVSLKSLQINLEVLDDPTITHFLFRGKAIDGVHYMIIRVTVTSPFVKGFTHNVIKDLLRTRGYILIGWRTASNNLRKKIREGIEAYRQKASANIEDCRIYMYGDEHPDGWAQVFGWWENTSSCSMADEVIFKLNQSNDGSELFTRSQFVLSALPRNE